MSYQYSITINQKAVIDYDLDLDIVDMAIFDFIQKFANSPKCVKMQTDKGTYYWISYAVIRESLPILRIKSNQGIANHIDKLIAANMLERYDNNIQQQRSYYRFGDNYDIINFVETPQENLGATPKNICRQPPKNFGGIINNNDNNINYQNNIIASEEEKTSNETKTLFRNSTLTSLVNGEDYTKFVALFPEFAEVGVDLIYYYHAVSDWSDSSNTKRTANGWKATIRNFIRSDKTKGTLHLVKLEQMQEKNQDLKELQYFLNL